MKVSAKFINLLACTWLTQATMPSVTAKAADLLSVQTAADHIFISSGRPKVVLVVFPGAYIEATRYRQLGETLVRVSQGEVAVVLANFFGNFANPLQAKSRIEIASKVLEAQGYRDASQRIFLAGHSQGGIMANDLPKDLKLGGLILLGSYLPQTIGLSKNLLTYPTPVLTLGGELDGFTGLNYLAREAQIARQVDTVQKPVIVLQGVNHLQFADGEATADDISPEVSLEDAHTAISKSILDFIAANTLFLSQDSDAAALKLQEAVDNSRAFFEPFEKAQQAVTGLCGNLQVAATPLTTEAWSKIEVKEKFYTTKSSAFSFILDKSRTDSVEGGFELHVPVYIERGPDPFDVSKDNYLSPEVIACKLRTLDKLVVEAGFPAAGRALNCAEMNARVIADSLSLLEATQKARLEARYGSLADWTIAASNDEKVNRVTFGPFEIRSEKKSTGQDWVAGRFNFNPKDSGWLLNTVELQTRNDVLISNFAGANYCKVLAPERIVEWATLFGLR